MRPVTMAAGLFLPANGRLILKLLGYFIVRSFFLFTVLEFHHSMNSPHFCSSDYIDFTQARSFLQ